MQVELISLDEMLENANDKERNCEDEQSFVSASLSWIPEEDTRGGWYNEKPNDLVSLFRCDEGNRETEE